MVRRLGLYCGIISPLLWLGLIAVAGAMRGDFNPVTHFISELGERGSSTEVLFRYGAFGFTGFLYVCFAAALRSTFRIGWLAAMAALLIALDGVGRMGAGVFPCDPGCIHASQDPDLHKMFATVGFCSGTLAAFVWALVCRRFAALKSLAPFSVVSGTVALISLLILSWSSELSLPAGLFEHLATVALSIWLLVFASRVISSSAVGQHQTQSAED